MDRNTNTNGNNTERENTMNNATDNLSETDYSPEALEALRNPAIVANYRCRLVAVHPGDTIKGLGEVVSNEPNGKNRLVTFTDGSTYNAPYNRMEKIQRPVTR